MNKKLLIWLVVLFFGCLSLHAAEKVLTWDDDYPFPFMNYDDSTIAAVIAQIFTGAGSTGRITSTAGDAGNFLKADGTWATPAGAGDFKADGSVPMTGPLNAGGQAVTNVDVVKNAAGVSMVIPIGGIIQYGNSNAPSGWLLCDGGGSHTNTFAALHAVIGYQFGGSGTNFLRPDLRRRVSAGMGSGYNLGAIGGYENVTLTTNQMPAHTHITTLDSFLCLRGNVAGTHWFAAGGKAYERLEEKTTSSAGGGLSHSNMPPYIVLNSIIFAGK